MKKRSIQNLAKRDTSGGDFREIPGFPGYRTNEYGVIVGRFGREMTVQVTSTGDRRVNATIDGKAKRLLIAEAVLLAWSGPKSSEWDKALHRDCNKANNHVSNLKWVSPSEYAKFEKKVGASFAEPSHSLKPEASPDELGAVYSSSLSSEETKVRHQPDMKDYRRRKSLPGRHSRFERPDGTEDNELPCSGDNPEMWIQYTRFLHQRICKSDLNKDEIKVILAFINYALQRSEGKQRFLSENEVSAITQIDRGPLARSLKCLVKRGLLAIPPDLPDSAHFYSINGKHSFFRYDEYDILNVWGDEYEELQKVLLADTAELPAPKRAAIERVYVPPVLSRDTWLTAEQVAEICCVTVEYVHSCSSNSKAHAKYPHPETLHCLRKSKHGEKRFEWPEVDRWRHAIFQSYLPWEERREYYRKTAPEPTSKAHAYFSGKYWYLKKGHH